jgi:DNA polymerase III delta prime subunit
MKEPLWVERYRPQTIDDCILPASIKDQFKNIVAKQEMPNLLLSGSAGTGKTTVAKALCKELDMTWIIINTSEETGIDTLRTKIREFASTASFSDNGKCVIMDEFDYASANLQAGLRNAMESFSKNCSFILTCNYPNRVIEPIHSRTVHIPFVIKKEDSLKLQASMYKRICAILENEKVEFDSKAVLALITKYYPDNRRILGELQNFSRAGSIGAEILMNLETLSVDQIIAAMKAKKFKDVRQWCAENSTNDLSTLYSKLYARIRDLLEPDSIPEAIMILEDYQRYDHVVPDKELHIAALCVNLMMQVKFK